MAERLRIISESLVPITLINAIALKKNETLMSLSKHGTHTHTRATLSTYHYALATTPVTVS